MKYDIFISYRREGGYDTAKHLNDLLIRDGYRVSFDIDTLRNGDFDTQLYERIDQCKDFILIVDQYAFDRTIDPCFDPSKDWLRCELAYALKKNKNIVPIFLSGVNGFPSNLPADVAQVVYKNGPEYNRYHFNNFYEILKKRFLHKRFNWKRFLLKIIFIILLVGIISLLINVMSQYTTGTPASSPGKERVEIVSDETDRGVALKNFCGSFTLTQKVGSYNHITELELDPQNKTCEKIIELDDGSKIVNITNSIGYYGTELQFVSYWNILSFNLSNDGKSALIELIPQSNDGDVPEVEKARLELDEYNNIKMKWLNDENSEEYFVRN